MPRLKLEDVEYLQVFWREPASMGMVGILSG